MTNSLATCTDGKKVRYEINCYVLHTVLLAIIF